MRMGMQDTPEIDEWLCSVLPAKSCVGVNPFLFSAGMVLF